MALDEPNEQDVTETIEDITFCMAKTLAAQTGELSLDLSYMGFMLSSEHPLTDPNSSGSCCATSGGTCGSCGSGGGCH